MDGYTCRCVPGYTGTDCEADINECADSTLCNSGTCNVCIIKQAYHVLLPPSPFHRRMNLGPTAVAVTLPTLEITVRWKSMNVTQVHVEMEEPAL